MSDDLIRRLGIIARAEMSNYAERTVNEAADTIARQQAMLDLALESNGDMMVRIGKLEEALNEIDALDPEGMIDGCAQTALRGLVLRMGGIARAALAQGKGE